MTLTERLKRGRDRIEAGWCKGIFRTQEYDFERVQYCAVGALINYGYSAMTIEQEREARIALTTELPWPHTTVHHFNDAPTTTKQDILDLYDRAMARPRFVRDGIGFTLEK